MGRLQRLLNVLQGAFRYERNVRTSVCQQILTGRHGYTGEGQSCCQYAAVTSPR